MKYIIIKDVRINLEHVLLYEEITGYDANNNKQLGISFQPIVGPRFNVWFDSVEERKTVLDKLDFHVKIE